MQARYPCVQVGGRSQGQVQGSECLVQEAGQCQSPSRARAGPHVLWVEENAHTYTCFPRRAMWGQVSLAGLGSLSARSQVAEDSLCYFLSLHVA